MRRLLLLLLLVSLPVKAEWRLFAENNSSTKWYVDLATIKRGSLPRAWFLLDYPAPTPSGTHSIKMLYQANCAEGRLREMSMHIYREPFGNGNPSSISNQFGEWEYPPPGTVVADMFFILCLKTP